MEKKYGFIGCGNMGGALIRSAVKSCGGDRILITDRFREKAEELAAETGAVCCEIGNIAEECSFIFLGVKPQNMDEMAGEIKDVLAERKDGFVLVSMAAGTSIEAVKQMTGDYPVIRIMPNLPVSIGEGMILYCSEDVEECRIEEFLDILRCAGVLTLLDEKLIDAGSAISGCGPAFAFMFMEALADGGVSCGLPRDKAQLLAAQTLMGSARLVLESGKHPGELKDAVCSPGGTTIAGVLALEDGGFRGDAADAVISAYEKTLQLANK